MTCIWGEETTEACRKRGSRSVAFSLLVVDCMYLRLRGGQPVPEEAAEPVCHGGSAAYAHFYHVLPSGISGNAQLPLHSVRLQEPFFVWGLKRVPLQRPLHSVRLQEPIFCGGFEAGTPPMASPKCTTASTKFLRGVRKRYPPNCLSTVYDCKYQILAWGLETGTPLIASPQCMTARTKLLSGVWKQVPLQLLFHSVRLQVPNSCVGIETGTPPIASPQCTTARTKLLREVWNGSPLQLLPTSLVHKSALPPPWKRTSAAMTPRPGWVQAVTRMVEMSWCWKCRFR
jgi:hypothetical protein